MANVTLVIDDELLRQAKLKAVQDGNSISAVLRELLGQYVHGSSLKQLAAIEAIFSFAPPPARQEARSWKRDDLYDR